MQEQLLKVFAATLRSLPQFRGKYRLGMMLQNRLMGNRTYRKPQVVVKMKEGFKMPIDVRSDMDFSAFWTAKYDTELINKFCSLFQEGWTVLDIGSNIGYYSIPFARKMEQLQGHVYSFEPLSTNFDALNQAIALNACQAISTYKIGIGQEKGTLGIALTEKGATGNAVLTNEVLIKERGFEPIESVAIEALDDFYVEQNIQSCDFIKVDIEGAEIYFLRGAKQTIEKYRPIIYGEFNAYFMEKNGESFREAWDYFTGIDYDIYKQETSHLRTTRFFKLDAYRERLADVLFIPRETPADVVARWLA
jgi:FkbM family methyltransferase